MNFSEYQEPVRQEYPSIKANAINDVEVVSVESFESTVKKTPGLKFKFKAVGQDLVAAPYTQQKDLWLSKAAENVAMEFLSKITNVCGVRDSLNVIGEETTKEEIATVLTKNLVGKQFRMGFAGREYLKDGVVKIAPEPTNLFEKIGESKLAAPTKIEKIVVPTVEADANNDMPF